MPFDPVTAALDIGGKVIDRLWPDPAQAAAAKLSLATMAQTGELARLTADTDLAKAQVAIDTIEATKDSMFVSGWRPMVGWVCVAGLAFANLVMPTILWVAYFLGYQEKPPTPDTGTLVTMLGSILGIGGLRTYEKSTGVQANAAGK